MAKIVSDKFFSLKAIKLLENKGRQSHMCNLQRDGRVSQYLICKHQKVGYCIQGRGLVSLRTPDRLETFKRVTL